MRALAILTLMILGTSPASAGQSSSPTIEDFVWMAGHWRGEGFGGQVEEVWSRPLGGTMMGTFRLVQDEEVAFYEIMVLERDAEGVVLKVKHFSREFEAWEEKADAVSFRLERLDGHAATFKGLTIARDGDSLEIKIRMRKKDGSTRWETLSLTAY